MPSSEFGVVGLGKFGLSLAASLMKHDQKVVGLDMDPDKVRAASEILTHAYQAEAVDKTALEQLGFGELPEVIVSTGHSMEASILVTLFLKELGCKSVTVKAISHDHEKVLRKVGADSVIFPRAVRRRTAGRQAGRARPHRLPAPGHQHHPQGDRGGRVGRQDPARPGPDQQLRGAGRGHQGPEDKQYTFVPKAGEPLRKGDALAVIGNAENLAEVES